MLLAAVVGGAVTVRLFWERFLSLFRRKKQDPDDALAVSEASPEATEQDT